MTAPPPAIDRISKHEGFTLLETLVALVVLAFLITGLVQGLQLGVRAWQAQMRSLAARGDLDAADNMLRIFFERMDPGGVSGRPPLFKGSQRRLVFTTTLPQAAEGFTATDVESSLSVDEAHRLQLFWLPRVRNRLGPPPPPSRVTLLNDVDHLELSYWQDSKEGWQQAWIGPSLPKLIRIRLIFVGASGRHAPDIVIMPMRDRWRL